MTDRPSEATLVSQLTRAMDGVEQSRLGDLEAAKALDELRKMADPATARAILPIYKDVLYRMEGAQDIQSRLTEFVGDEDGEGGHR